MTRITLWVSVSVLLAIVFALQVTSAMQESQTIDEATHLAAGYSYWETGDFRLNPEHPPLSKLIAALPLLWLQPSFAPNPDDWRFANQYPIGKSFLYSNRIPADQILLAGRAMTMLLGLILCASVAVWVARRAGVLAGIAALLLLAFDPTVLAHSRYVTSDIPVTLFIWLSCIAWYSYLEHGGRWRLVGAGLLTGLAFATKLNAVYIPLLFLLLAWFHGRRLPWRAVVALSAIAAVVVVAAYGFDVRSIAEDPGLTSRVAKYPKDGLEWKAAQLRVPGYYFLRGLNIVARHHDSGHASSFFGTFSRKGFWTYFPFALLLKSCVAWLAALLLAGATVFVQREKRKPLLFLALCAGVYFGTSMLSSINIGIRHVLPAYPFLCAFVAIALFDVRQRVAIRVTASLLMVFFLIESALAYPNYLSHFNLAVGGSKNGYRYLTDSNIDWGQDLKRLAHYIETHDVQPLCLAYWGTADPAYYGITRHQPLPVPLKNAEDMKKPDCVAAVSLEYLYGTEDYPMEALHGVRPTDRVGDSILIFDLRKK